jgi:hypothetical protein
MPRRLVRILMNASLKRNSGAEFKLMASSEPPSSRLSHRGQSTSRPGEIDAERNEAH